MKLLSFFDVMVKVHEALTTPEFEDWLLIPDRTTVHIAAFRQQIVDGTPQVKTRHGKARLDYVKRLVSELPDSHDLGCCIIVIPSDGGKPAREFLAWMTQQS